MRNVLVLLLLAPALARAETPPEGGGEETEAPAATVTNEGPAPVRATSFLMAHAGIDDAILVPVMRDLDDGLKRNPRLEVKDLDTRLADFAMEVPSEEIEQGRQQFKDGMAALTGLELPKAIKTLTLAIDTLSKVLPYIKKQELADAMTALAAAQFEQGDKKGARATLIRLLTWRNDYRLDTNRYPPSLVVPLEEARKEVERTKRGSLEIRTEPVPAQAYVDGKYIGVTPTFAEGLTAGEHFVTLKRDGYHKAVTSASVSAKVQQVVTVQLERSPKFLLVEQALKALEKQLGKDKLEPSVDTLKEVLFLDHAVFVRAAPDGGQMKLDVYLYDLRTRKLLSHVEQVAPKQGHKETLASVPSTLYLNVDYDAELVAPKDAPPPPPKKRKPVYKAWWFWTVLAVAAGGVVVGATVGAQTAPKSCADQATCPAFTF
jgi:hypothetical protein